MSKVLVKRKVFKVEQGEDHDMFCDPCLRLSIRRRAHSYCTSCKESFCRCCKVVHINSRMSMNHMLIRAGLQKTDPNLFLTLSDIQFCRRHDTRRVKWYCEDDSEFCCSLCMKREHRGCVDVKDLSDMSSEDSEQKLADVKDDFKKFFEELDNTRAKIVEERDGLHGKFETKVRSELQKLRDNFNKSLDRAEKSFLEEAQHEEVQQRRKMSTLLQNVNELAEKSKVRDFALKIVESEGTESNVKYACYGRIEQEVNKLKKELDQLCSDATTKKIRMAYTNRFSGFQNAILDIGCCAFDTKDMFPLKKKKPRAPPPSAGWLERQLLTREGSGFPRPQSAKIPKMAPLIDAQHERRFAAPIGLEKE